MTARERNFDELLNDIERREGAAKRRALLWTLVPAVAAVALLGYSSWRLSVESAQVEQLARKADSLQRTVADREAQIRTLQDSIKGLQQRLSETQAQLRDTVELAKFRHPVDFVDLKVIYSRYPRQARILEQILNLRQSGVKWKLGGQQPAEGFDSPSFAAYILRKMGLAGGEQVPGESLLESSRRLYQRLAPASSPQVGDLVFYPAGYALFYFEDQNRRPFVIGMTPAGIASLNPNFAPRVGVRRPGSR